MSRRTALRVGGGALIAGFAGCLELGASDSPDGGDWPTFGSDAANTGATRTQGPTEPGELWTAEVGVVIGSPAVVGDTVYVGTAAGDDYDDGDLYALDAETGDERWSFDIGAPVYGTPAVAGDAIYVLSHEGAGDEAEASAVAIGLDGDEEWTSELPGMSGGSLAVVDDTVYALTFEGLYALDAETGDERWSEQGFWTSLEGVAVAGDTVYVGAQSRWFALDAESGDELWSYGAEDGAHTSVGVVAGEELIYFPTTGGDGLVAVAADTGETEWTAEGAWFTHTPALADGTVYAGIEPGGALQDVFDETGSRIVALDAEAGEREWEFDRTGTDDLGLTPIVGNDAVYARTFDGLYALDADGGSIHWEYDDPFGLPWEEGPFERPPDSSQGLASQPVLVDGVLFVASATGGVYAVGEA